MIDENILQISIKKFLTRGFYEQHLDFPQIVKNAKLLYRDLLSASHIVYMAELYKQYSDQNYASRFMYSAALKAFDPGQDGEPPLYMKDLASLINDYFAKGHFLNNNASVTSADQEGGEPLEDEGQQLHF